MPTVDDFHANPSFHAQHSPMGAFFSFTCGRFGSRGGMAAQRGRPANQDLFIGVKDGSRTGPGMLKCLPFFDQADKAARVADAAAQAYLVEQARAESDPAKKPPKVAAYGREQIRRRYGWATDAWTTEDFQFMVYTPFGEILDPHGASPGEMRRALLPAVLARLTIDNSAGKSVRTGFFAIGFHDSGLRILDEGLGEGRTGFAQGRTLGVAGRVIDGSGRQTAGEDGAGGAFAFMRWSPDGGLEDRDNPVHLLGGCPGIGFEVPPGQVRTLELALGCHLEEIVTTRLEGRYLYTRYFGGLTDVLGAAFDESPRIVRHCAALDRQLAESKLNLDQRFLLAHATRSYYGSTQLLDMGGEPYWIVNEGEYVMINTLDLSVDQLFWELRHNPWVVRNLLDNFVRFYSYHDQVKVPGGDPCSPGGDAPSPGGDSLSPGGITFCHDQGKDNQFAPLGHSSYELTDLDGCFSHMSQEQLCNWILLAAGYVAATGDSAWARSQATVIRGCLLSMQNRDDPDPSRRIGITRRDSSRCGRGAEITTYDSLDHSLAQTRNNLYIAVKDWASYLGLVLLLEKIGDADAASDAIASAKLAQETIVGQMTSEGWIPAVFEPGNPGHDSRILPAIEGLVYPLFWARQPHASQASRWIDADGPFGALIAALRRHATTLLSNPARGDSANRFADGGVRLSSTSKNSWMSKIGLALHVCRTLFHLDENGAEQPSPGPGGWTSADSAHTAWQTEGASAYWACSDQIVSGVAQGSKYYPRIVTTVLWMDE